MHFQIYSRLIRTCRPQTKISGTPLLSRAVINVIIKSQVQTQIGLLQIEFFMTNCLIVTAQSMLQIFDVLCINIIAHPLCKKFSVLNHKHGDNVVCAEFPEQTTAPIFNLIYEISCRC